MQLANFLPVSCPQCDKVLSRIPSKLTGQVAQALITTCCDIYIIVKLAWHLVEVAISMIA